jgi:hypothetical protein
MELTGLISANGPVDLLRKINCRFLDVQSRRSVVSKESTAYEQSRRGVSLCLAGTPGGRYELPATVTLTFPSWATW